MGSLQKTKQSPSLKVPGYVAFSSSFKVDRGVVFYTGSSNSGTALRGGVGGEKNLSFPFFQLAKRQRGPLGQGDSTNFVADCCY